jgi:hypothetical protein
MQDATASEAPSPNTTPVEQLPNALRLLTGTYHIVCRRFGDPNVLPFLHVNLVFVHHLTFCPDAMAHVAPHFPWKLTAFMLNTLLKERAVAQALARLLEGEQFPGSGQIGKEVGGDGMKQEDGGSVASVGRRKRPLPDDFAIRGFPWVEKYFPDGWFDTKERIADYRKYFERQSMSEERRERVMWLGCRIAEREGGKWLQLDKEAKQFGVNPAYKVKLDLEMPGQTLPATPGKSVDYGELPGAGTVA